MSTEDMMQTMLESLPDLPDYVIKAMYAAMMKAKKKP